jgi:hypothetical protein
MLMMTSPSPQIVPSPGPRASLSKSAPSPSTATENGYKILKKTRRMGRDITVLISALVMMKVLFFGDIGSNVKYWDLFSVVKGILIMVHDQSSIERGF